MLGLPQNSEVLKQLPKKSIYTKFNLSNSDRVKFDSDVSKLFIVNALSPSSINIQEGEKVKSIYVILVELKKEKFSDKNIALIAKLIPHNIIFLLRYEEQGTLAVYYSEKVIKGEWTNFNDLQLNITGLNLDVVFENFITQIGSITIEEDKTLPAQLEINDKRLHIKNEIEKLNKQISAEKQPHRKYELMEKKGRLKKELASLK